VTPLIDVKSTAPSALHQPYGRGAATEARGFDHLIGHPPGGVVIACCTVEANPTINAAQWVYLS
jgi:hypothetical protein